MNLIPRLKHKINLITQIAIPFIGHFGFMPILSMLMNVFLCEKGIGNNLTDSFLNQDCTSFCYKGNHLTNAILTGLCLLIYLPTAIYFRPYWEVSHEFLHFRTKSYYLSVLSMAQVIVVILSKTLKPYDQNIHGSVLCVIILLFIWFTIYSKPYNDKRTEVMQCTSLCLAFWVILISTIFRNFGFLDLWFAFQLVGGLLIIGLAYFLIRKLPLLIYTEPGVNISMLFLFQFSRTFKRYESIVSDSRRTNEEFN